MDNKGVITLNGNGDSDISLLDILDHVLNAGVVIQGSLVISVAGVDLIYLGLSVVLTSVETAMKHAEKPGSPQRHRDTEKS
jgi:gas vesicle structural protein